MQADEDLAQEFLTFCESVYKDALVIARHAREGQTNAADEAARQLAQTALTTIQTLLSAQEQARASHNDLAALSVNALVPSNSETGWEREK